MNRQRAFSLVELMLAMTLIAVILGLAYGGFRAATRATFSGEVVIERTNRVRVAHQFLRQQLLNTLPLIMEQQEEERYMFEGDRDWMRFVAPMPGYLSYGGPYVQELRLERGGNGYDLVFSYALLNGYEPGDLEDTVPVVLLEGIRSGTFSYIGFNEEGEPGDWNDFWEHVEFTPLAVRIDLDMNEDTGIAWPTLATALMIDGGARTPAQVRPGDLIDPAARARQRGQPEVRR